jgi:hypothetical protein
MLESLLVKIMSLIQVKLRSTIFKQAHILVTCLIVNFI